LTLLLSKTKHKKHEAAKILREFLQGAKRTAREYSELLKAEGYDLDKLNAGQVRRKAGTESKKIKGERVKSRYWKGSS